MTGRSVSQRATRWTRSGTAARMIAGHNRRRALLGGLFVLVASLVGIGPADHGVPWGTGAVLAQDAPARPVPAGFLGDPTQLPGREPRPKTDLVVPWEQVEGLISGDGDYVFLPPDEADRLAELAAENRRRNPTPRGIDSLIVSTRYVGELLEHELRLRVVVRFRQFLAGYQAIYLPVARLSVQRAELDGQPAFVSRSTPDVLVIYSDKAGEHELKLDLTTELVAAGSDLMAGFQLLPSPTGVLELQLPPKKRLLFNGFQLERPAAADQPANYEVAIGGLTEAQVRVTDGQSTTAADALAMASTTYGVAIQPGEVAWLARTQLAIFGQPINRVTLTVPRPLEVADVTGPGLESWDLTDDDPTNPQATVITLNFAQGFEGTRELSVRGVFATDRDRPWRVPQLRIAGVTSHVGRIVLAHPAGVRLRVGTTVGLRQSAELDPASVPLKPEITQQWQLQRFDAWREDFELEVATETRQHEVHAVIAAVAELTSQGADLACEINVRSLFGTLFEVHLPLAGEWQVRGVTSEGQPVAWRLEPAAAGVNRLVLPLATPLAQNQSRTISLSLQRLIEGWPAETTSAEFELPELAVVPSNLTETVLAIRADDDLDVSPTEVTGLDLIPLGGAGERFRYQAQDTRYRGRFTVKRKPSQWSARSVHFARLDQQALAVHAETVVTVQGGGVRSLEVTLPADAPRQLRFEAAGAGGRIVEQKLVREEQGRAVWSLQFENRLRGETRVWTQLTNPRTARDEQPADGAAAANPAAPDAPAAANPAAPNGPSAPNEWNVPLLSVSGAAPENGYLAVEASGEQRVISTARNELGQQLAEADALDLPPATYRPKERVIAVFRMLRPGATLSLAEQRYDRAAIPTAVGLHLTVKSLLGTDGEWQHEAAYLVEAPGVQSLEAALPAGAQLWACLVDRQPVEVRATGSGFRFSWPNVSTAGARHIVQLFYRVRAQAPQGSGVLEQLAPQIAAITGRGERQPLLVLDQRWELKHPHEVTVLESLTPFRALQGIDSPSWFRGWLVGGFRLEQWLGRLGVLMGVAVLALVGVVWPIRSLRTGAESGCWTVLKIMLSILVTAVVCGLVFAAFGSRGCSSVRQHAVGLSQPPANHAPLGGRHSRLGVTLEAQDSLGVLDNVEFVDESVQREMLFEKRFTKGAAEPDSDFSTLRSKANAAAKDQPLAGKPLPSQVPSAPAGPDAAMPAFGVNENAGVDGRFDDGAPVPGPENQNLPAIAAQPQPARRAAGRQGVADRWNETLLSAQPQRPTLSLAIQSDSELNLPVKRFRYLGNAAAGREIGLKLGYMDRYSGTAVRGFWAMAAVLVSWCLMRTRVLYGFVSVVSLVIAALAILQLGNESWQIRGDGLLMGALVAVALWLGQIVWLQLRDLIRLALASLWWLWGVSPTQASPAGIAGTAGGASGRVTLNLLPWFLLLAVQWSGANSNWAQADEQPSVKPRTKLPSLTERIVFGGAAVRPKAEGTPSAGEPESAAERVLMDRGHFEQLFRDAYPERRPGVVAPENGGVMAAYYIVTPEPAAVGGGAGPAEQGLIKVTARYLVRSEVKGQLQVTLPVQQVAFSKVLWNGQPAVLNLQGGRPSVIVDAAGWSTIDAEFQLAARVSNEAGQFALTLDPVPLGGLTVSLPEGEREFRLNGTSTAYRSEIRDQRQWLDVACERGGEIAVAWQPRLARRPLGTVLHAESALAVTIDDAGLRLSQGLQLQVRQGELASLRLQLPDGVRLKGVAGEDVAGWEISPGEAGRVMQVLFRRAVADSTRLTFELFDEQSIETALTWAVPNLIPLDITHEVGLVGVFAAPQLSVRAESAVGLTQLNPDRFATSIPLSRPQTLPNLAYRFASRPLNLSLKITRLESRLQAVVQQAVQVQYRKQLLSTRILATISGSPRASLRLKLPSDLLVLSVSGGSLRDWYLAGAAGSPELLVEFVQPVTGNIELVVESSVPRDPAQSELQLNLPSVLDAARVEQTLGLWLDESFSAVVDQLGGWRSLDPQALPEAFRQVISRPANLAFEVTEAAPAAVKLSLSRATPVVRGESLVVVNVTDLSVGYSVLVRLEVEQAATDRLSLTTPAALADRLNWSAEGLHDIRTEPLPDGRMRWTLQFRSPMKGTVVLSGVALLPPAAQEVTAPLIRIETPESSRIGWLDSPRQTQSVLLVNVSQSQLTNVSLDQAEPIRPDELQIVIPAAVMNQGTELLRLAPGADELRWTVQQFETTAGIAASVNLADFLTVVAVDGSFRTQVDFRIKNLARQFLPLRLPAGCELLSAGVDGQPTRVVTTQRNGETVYLVPLPKVSAADLAFPVRVVYSGQLSEALPSERGLVRQRVQLPVLAVVSPEADPELGVPVAATRWTVSWPRDYSARPEGDVRLTNLNWEPEDSGSLIVANAVLREMNELLEYSESAGNRMSQRAVAAGNLRQLGQILSSYDAGQLKAGDKAAVEQFREQQVRVLRRAEEVNRKIVEELAVQQQGQPAVVSGNTMVIDDEAQLKLAITNGSELVRGNTIAAPAETAAGTNQRFNFDTSGLVDSYAQSKPDVAKQAVDLSRSDVRQQYRNLNEVQLGQLSKSLSDRKRSKEEQSQALSRLTEQEELRRAGADSKFQRGLSRGGDARGDVLNRQYNNLGSLPQNLDDWEDDVNGPSSGDKGGMVGGSVLGRGGPGGMGGGMGGGGMGGGFSRGRGPRDAAADGEDNLGGEAEFAGRMEGRARNRFAAPNAGGAPDPRFQQMFGDDSGAGGNRFSRDGLSLVVELPQDERTLVLTKAGGDPQLTLVFTPESGDGLVLQWLSCAYWAVLGGSVLLWLWLGRQTPGWIIGLAIVCWAVGLVFLAGEIWLLMAAGLGLSLAALAFRPMRAAGEVVG